MSTSSAARDEGVGSVVSQRWLLIVALVVALGLLTVAVVYVNRDPFAELPSDPSVTVNYAGVFPAADEQPLDQPFGIAIRGRRVYVAESGTGSIRIFNLHGESRGRIVLPAAEESRAVPTAIALTDDGRIAVIDAITRNVSVFRARSDDSAEALFVLGEDDPATAPVRPMGVAFADGEFFVVDGGDPLVRVYDEDGRLVRALGEDLEQPIENPGGIAAVDGELLVSDTKSGQVAVLDGAEGGEVRRFPDAYVVPRTIAPAGDGLVLTDVLGQAVYVTDARGARTHVIDSTTVPDWTPGLPEGVAWTPVKDRAYVTDNRSGHVWVFNVRM